MRFIIPNYHVILIHLPLALLGVGLLGEIFSFLWRRSSFRLACRWMILLGTLLLLPTVTSGIFALFDVVGHGQSASNSWEELKAVSGFSAYDWDLAKYHVLLNSIGAGIALISVIAWLGATDQWRSRLYLPLMLAMIIGMSFITMGSWHGGEMIFREGFGVQGRQGVLQETGAQPTAMRDKIDAAVSPMQIHVIMAGFVFAVAAAALGLTLRRSWLGDDLLVQRMPLDEAATELSAPPAIGATSSPTVSVTPVVHVSGSPTVASATVVSAVAPRVPSARFWVIAGLLALLTIVLGLYVGDFITGNWSHDWEKFRYALGDVRTQGVRRIGLHILFGSSILILTFILAILARWSPRKRTPLAAISALLVLIMAAQVWMGILLLYDGDHGSFVHFKPTGTVEMTHRDPQKPM